MTKPQTSKEKQQDYRARMTLLGMKEVRGIYLPPELHAKLKQIARKQQVSTAREVQPEEGGLLGNSAAPAAGNLVTAIEEALASLDCGMVEGAACTLRDALYRFRQECRSE